MKAVRKRDKIYKCPETQSNINALNVFMVPCKDRKFTKEVI